MKKRILAWLLVACLMMSAMPVMAFATEAASDQCDHELIQHEGKEPTYTESGWEPYETCAKECGYTTFKAIPALQSSVENYQDFLYYLAELEELAVQYVKEKPGKDPVALVIKYIRTGVDRYNSGSWSIMAGYEDTEFANYVRRIEGEKNAELADGDDPYLVTSLKNIEEFTLPNGDLVDFGHMFGTMDISYHNKGSQAHADVGGWAGDLVDLMTSSDRAYGKSEDSTVHLTLPADLDLETMVEQISSEIFLQVTCPDDKFNQTDFYGDLDGMYIINTLYETEYKAGDMAEIIEAYCTESLSDEDRASYFMKERLGNSGTRAQVRAAVYEEFTSNKTITTLESTREWMNTDSDYLMQLRKATCYAFADYVCKLAGDYVEAGENPYYTDFHSEISYLAPGVTQEIRKATSADGKQMVYYLATADLSNPYVTVNANYANNDPSSWAPARVLDQAEAAQENRSNPEHKYYVPNYQIVAAINADGFSMASGVPSGVLVMDGVEWNPINSHGFFGITMDGEAVIGTTQEYNTIYKGKIRDAVSGFGTTLVKDGKVNITATSNYYSDRASRTAVGITKTGKVVFMVLDGRQEPVSCGGSMVEIAQIMLEAGCVDAINLDGGGSTTFVSKPEGQDKLQVTNNPSDGYARNVSSTLIMVSTAPSSTAFDHAIIESDYSYATTDTEVQLKAVGVSATGNVAEMPEGYTWAVSDERLATVTDEGVFTGLRNGAVEVYLMLDGEIIGSKTMNMVVPNSVYFTRKNMNAVYGSSITLPVAALYEGKAVAIHEADVNLTLSNDSAGYCEGFEFYAEESEIKNVVITATLAANNAINGIMNVNLYKQGENTFDFDKADGGDEQLAWTRVVSNAAFDGNMTYSVVDRNQNMEVSYIFAVDMSQITMPEKLDDLLYMLPGADDPDASAWNFMLQLAERISVLTEVTATVQVDPNFTVDINELNIINEYFYLVKSEINEETNEVIITMRWKDQTMAIDAATANPLCIINGIKLIPKDDLFAEDDVINVTSGGTVGYRVFLRTSTLHSFCQKPENQQQYGLLPFTNTFIDANGEEQYEAGGYFVNKEYKSFTDYFNLSYAKKQGWVKEDGGWAYYVDDERATGVQEIGGFYYDFGENGLNAGQKKFSGFFTDAAGKHYVRIGEIVTSGWTKDGNVGYHCHADGCLYEAAINDPTSCIQGGKIVYTCATCKVSAQVGDYVFPQGHVWSEQFKCEVCGFDEGKDVATATMAFGTIENPKKPGGTWYYNGKGGLRPSFYVTFDGKTTLTYSNDANVNSDGTMRDLYVSWNNDKGIGKAVMNIQGKGNYYGAANLVYYILPFEAKNLEAEVVGLDAVKLTWTPGGGSLGDGADAYRISVDSKSNVIADITETSYIVTGLSAGKHTFYVMAHAASDNPEEDGVDYNAPRYATATATTEMTMPELETPEVVQGENEQEVKVNVEFDAEPVTDGSWNVIVVAYNEDGMMIDISYQTITGKSLSVAMQNIQSAYRLDIYVVDGTSKPLMTPGTIDLSDELALQSAEDTFFQEEYFVVEEIFDMETAEEGEDAAVLRLQ